MTIGGTDQSQRRAASRARPGDVTAVHGQETAARACAAAGARLTSDENRVATPNSPPNSPPFVHAKKLGHNSTKLGHGTKTKMPVLKKLGHYSTKLAHTYSSGQTNLNSTGCEGSARPRCHEPHLQFATATANLASQNAFLFLATHGPIFIASSSSATLIQCGFQSESQLPVAPLELLPHPSTRCEDDRYKVHTTLLA